MNSKSVGEININSSNLSIKGLGSKKQGVVCSVDHPPSGQCPGFSHSSVCVSSTGWRGSVTIKLKHKNELRIGQKRYFFITSFFPLLKTLRKIILDHAQVDTVRYRTISYTKNETMKYNTIPYHKIQCNTIQ